MARKPLKGTYVLKFPDRYFGENPNNITYRSGWELQLFEFLDSGDPSILGWASETISIPYKNPLTQKWSMYVPDILVVFQDKHGKRRVEMIEVKPMKEVPGYNEKKISRRTQLAQAINAAKWAAAMAFCKKRGWTFRVATEKDLFKYEKKK